MDHPHQNTPTDPYTSNRMAITKANAFLLKRVSLCACLNMTLLSATSPFMIGFSGSSFLYIVCAVLTCLLTLFCHFYVDKQPQTALPIYYGLLLGLCAYGTALSTIYYPNIHGVTLIAIYTLAPIILLDRSWRVNLFLSICFLFTVIFTIAFKPWDLAVDDCITCGAFLVFGAMIGNYLRTARLRAIDQQRLLELQRDIDVLTGLSNRRVLFETLDKIEQTGENATVGGIIMIDIDDFKLYNDKYGHLAGDECLHLLGERFLAFSTETGVKIYRYGGEEFLGLWRSGTELELGELAWRLVNVARVCMPSGQGITISVGYAYRDPDSPVTNERLIYMADSALYEAKRQGRDRAVFYMGSNGFAGDHPKAENTLH